MPYDNTNRGVLFDKRATKKSDKHPDLEGNINIDGTEYFLDAWINLSEKTGETYFSLKRGNPKRAKG